MRFSMAERNERRSWVMINRAPVLTLWAAVVAEVLGFEHDEALTLGRAVAVNGRRSGQFILDKNGVNFIML